jgi:hypothetical protein
MSRYHYKGNALVAAWQTRYAGTLPTKHAVVMCCAVAEHETMCGDAWNHSGNWGAIQRRRMTAAERAVVASGGTPAPTDAFEQLHGDSSPITGRYATWFWAFPKDTVYPPAGLAGDAAGAWKLLEVLLDERPVIQEIIDSIDVQSLASDMYHTHYYEGVHDPRKPGGVDANIADYGHALAWTSGAFSAGLADWQPGGNAGAGAGTASPDLSTTLGVQQALNRLGVADPPLDEDGINGPKTRAAVILFQQQAAIQVDGVIGPQTRAALASALAAQTG